MRRHSHSHQTETVVVTWSMKVTLRPDKMVPWFSLVIIENPGTQQKGHSAAKRRDDGSVLELLNTMPVCASVHVAMVGFLRSLLRDMWNRELMTCHERTREQMNGMVY